LAALADSFLTNESILMKLRDPDGGGSLRLSIEDGKPKLLGASGTGYCLDGGIARFLPGRSLSGNNGKYQLLYDRLAPLYNLITGSYAFMRNGGEKKRVLQYLSALQVRDGDAVIEVSIGTGRNIKYLNPQAEYWGVDISLGMLAQCKRSMARQHKNIFLLQAQAECLPLSDESFDVVFSAGGFNFFNDRHKAVQELLRIAKHGTKLMISDETEKVRKREASSPVANQFYKNQEIGLPTSFIPSWCTDVEYREICDGELYVLTFIKP
jgi:ubiquinone/menaquinone biosynthesis C-methylase UbiE